MPRRGESVSTHPSAAWGPARRREQATAPPHGRGPAHLPRRGGVPAGDHRHGGLDLLRPGPRPRPGPDPADPLDAEVRAGRHVLHAPPVRPCLVLVRVHRPPPHRGRPRRRAPVAFGHIGTTGASGPGDVHVPLPLAPEVALGLEAPWWATPAMGPCCGAGVGAAAPRGVTRSSAARRSCGRAPGLSPSGPSTAPRRTWSSTSADPRRAGACGSGSPRGSSAGRASLVVGRLGLWLTRPLPALALASAVQVAWHVPAAFAPLRVERHAPSTSRSSPPAPLRGRWRAGPSGPGPSPPAQLLYLFLATIPDDGDRRPITLAEDLSTRTTPRPAVPGPSRRGRTRSWRGS
jgi:hypothetical protein